MKAFYDAVYLSPHLDDAALSCGGQIYDLTAAGKTALIVTIMAGDPSSIPTSQFARSLHRRWQLDSGAVKARRAEDVAACQILGADWQHWDFLDCIYRVDPQTKQPLYTSDEAIFGEIDPAESDLVEALAGRMALLPGCSRLFAPLTLGNHVDHQLTRRAAEQCFPASLRFYYEDYPYAGRYSAEQFVAGQAGSWQDKVIRLSENGAAARIQAIKCYESQLSTFFRDESDLEAQLMAFIHATGGERVWKQLQD